MLIGQILSPVTAATVESTAYTEERPSVHCRGRRAPKKPATASETPLLSSPSSPTTTLLAAAAPAAGVGGAPEFEAKVEGLRAQRKFSQRGVTPRVLFIRWADGPRAVAQAQPSRASALYRCR